MFRVFDVNIRFLTWIRYTAWVVLYPLGFIAEGIPLKGFLFNNQLLFGFRNDFIQKYRVFRREWKIFN